jgi:CheY-like chemotaxis protein
MPPTVEVEDTGPGVAENMRERIFERFEQGREETGPYQPRPEGAGLGLSISRELVQLMRGWLRCLPPRSEEGAIFAMELPLQAPSPLMPRRLPVREPKQPRPLPLPLPLSPPRAAAVEGQPSPSKRALLVEDNPLNQRIGVMMLQRLGMPYAFLALPLRKISACSLFRVGCNVQVASNGQEAVSTLAAAPSGFDIVFMDCQMPVLDGLAATRQIRAAGNKACSIKSWPETRPLICTI